jgi:hypothetical protein
MSDPLGSRTNTEPRKGIGMKQNRVTSFWQVLRSKFVQGFKEGWEPFGKDWRAVLKHLV